jgi:hypothetical protein
MLQIQQHLIRRAIGQGGAKFLQILHIEVGDAPAQNFPGRPHPLHRLDRLFQGNGATPVQQIEIKARHAEPFQAALAGLRQRAAGGILRIDLGDEKDLIPPPGDGLAHHFLGAALGVHFRGVDQGQAQIEPGAQGRDLGLPVGRALSHMPAALAQCRHGSAIGQCDALHARLSSA